MRKYGLGAVLTAFVIYLASCASIPVVAPTPAEIEAARNFKQTAAVLAGSDDSAQIKGLLPILENALESVAVNLGTVNLVEREQMKKIMKEKALKLSGIAEDKAAIKEMGTVLGADYLLIPDIIYASLEGPQKAKTSISRRKEKKTGVQIFSRGKIWDEMYASSKVTLKVIEVKSGIITASVSKNYRAMRKINMETYKTESAYRAALELRRGYRNLDLASKLMQSLVGKKVSKDELDEDYRILASQSVEKAAYQMKKKLAALFPLEGEILKIVSPKEVSINLGSAFGMKPGKKLSAWSRGSSLTDPRTGTTTVSKRFIGRLKITEVSSGLSSIAKGSKKVISRLKTGDIVTTTN
ncbi:MAG: CsgG/HfaB family protein [Elusimicrobiota bacterium]|nr:CsgG/HfaB family protein [Elusimicrobiota bacterium]